MNIIPSLLPIDMVSALERIGGEMEFLEELIEMFFEDFSEKFTMLKDAVNKQDATQVQEIAHNLKGSSANLGLSPLQETFYQMETAGRNNNLIDADKKIELLQIQFNELKNFWNNRDQIGQDQKQAAPKTANQNNRSQAGNDLSEQESGTIKVDTSILDLVPTYLENRRSDTKLIHSALEINDILTIETLAHKMKGSGTSYGFEQISLIGKLMELSARENDRDEIHLLLKKLEFFLEKVQYE